MSEIVDGGARVVVLVNPTEDGTRRVIGYSVSDPARKVIHWIYVKRDWRGLGFGRAIRRQIVPDNERSGWVYTYRTDACSRFMRGMKHDKSKACIKV